MEGHRPGISMETLRALAEQAGLRLSDKELAETAKFYDTAGTAHLRGVDLEPVGPALIFRPE